MNRPPFFYFILGHGLIVGSALVFMFIALGLWAAGASALVPVGAIAAALWVGRARTQVARYRQWHREWEALDPSAAPSRRQAAATAAPESVATDQPRARSHWLLWAVVAVSWLCLAGTVKTPKQQAGLVWFTVLIVAYLAFLAVARLWRRQAVPASVSTPTPKMDDTLVRQCVTRPLYAVPPLGVAYQQLPHHCLQTLQTCSL
ncbi:hypothetical protein [Tahibacter caeni]|uniref:hypothetical protein n=1 Tax=Tahibacter caeni TaxID=1453545 RepID=UPI0021485EB0|nr:hypothetical protein [Tahibacter caeni]